MRYRATRFGVQLNGKSGPVFAGWINNDQAGLLAGATHVPPAPS